jgi:hypothetical protein
MSDGYRLANLAAASLFDEPMPDSGAELFTAFVTAVSWPTCKIRPTRATTAGDQLVGLCLGTFPVVGARVVCAWIGGEPVVLGTIAPPEASTATREFDFPFTILGDAIGIEPHGGNSATTGSSTDTVNYVTNFADSFVLPAYGTFSVWSFTWQMVSHSAEAGNVRVATQIEATVGAADESTF